MCSSLHVQKNRTKREKHQFMPFQAEEVGREANCWPCRTLSPEVQSFSHSNWCLQGRAERKRMHALGSALPRQSSEWFPFISVLAFQAAFTLLYHINVIPMAGFAQKVQRKSLRQQIWMQIFLCPCSSSKQCTCCSCVRTLNGNSICVFTTTFCYHHVTTFVTTTCLPLRFTTHYVL